MSIKFNEDVTAKTEQIDKWRIRGYDPLDDEFFEIPGTWFCESDARDAAFLKLKYFERSQPAALSGGQKGVQDQVFVLCPNGSTYRVYPSKDY